MSELERAIVERNARFWAWQQLGVPVEGRWFWVERPWRYVRGGGWQVWIGCSECRYGSDRPLKGDLEQAEHFLLLALTDGGCTHLTHLLGPEPEELPTLAALATLADPGLGGGR